jgi:CelD/BcsL family acetyltransferase involved in cellulose biosynthesis
MNFRLGPTEYAHLLGHDRSWARHSLGQAIAAHSVRAALGEGASTIVLGYGLQPYKERLATSIEEVDTVAAPRSLRGRLALRAERAIRRRPTDEFLRGVRSNASTHPPWR